MKQNFSLEEQNKTRSSLTRLRIQVLGGFAAWVDGMRLGEEDWHSKRARSLVKLLALAPGYHLARDQAADTLWPDSDPAASANNFHQSLYAARRIVGADHLVLEEGWLKLVNVEVDAAAFEEAAQQARASHDPADYQAAVALYTGDLLPADRYEEWTLQRREALRQRCLTLLFDLANLYEQSHDHPTAIQTLQRLLAADPCHESAHAGLMRLYARSGQRQAALRQYKTLCEALRAELDVDPGEPITQLYQAIQSGAFPAETASPPAIPTPPVSARAHNLPLQLTSFIGREAQVVEVADLVRRNHLVTITGSGGVGKTRLAMQVARELLAFFADGVCLVELAPVSDPALVARTVAGALEVHEHPGQDVLQTLARILRVRSLLLLLDNCEQVVGGVASLAVQLLQGCPHLHILATSREILGVEGELVFRCPSLSLPGEESSSSQDLPNLDEAAGSEAVHLFVERTRNAWPEFQLTKTNTPPVVQICRRLDGIPLAIELAAARTRILTVEQIAARLDHAFSLLTGGSQQALPRHQTLRALIDWSYQLLAPEERLLLQRLSVFAGGWTLETAEQVCADPPDEPAGLVQVGSEQMIDLLGRLVDKSMVQFTPAGSEEPRFHMLENIRQYAHDLLVSGKESHAVHDRHLNYYLSLALQAQPHLRAWGSRGWLDRLEHELDNIRLALNWSISAPEVPGLSRLTKGLQFAASLHWLWWTRNHATEGVAWLERLLNEQNRRGLPHTLPVEGQAARGRAMTILSRLIFECQVTDIPCSKEFPAQALYQESQAIFLALGAAYRRDYALARYFQVDHLEPGEENYLACRDLFRAVNDRFWESECEKDLAIFYQNHWQDLEKASAACERGLAIRKEIGDLEGQATQFSFLAFYEIITGSASRSVDLANEAINLFDQSGNRQFAAHQRCNLAYFFIHQGNYEDAASLLGVACSLAQTMRIPSLSMCYDRVQGYLALEKREYEQAVRACGRVIEMNKDFPYSRITHIFYILARVALSRGEACQVRPALKEMLAHGALTEGKMRLGMIHALGLLSAQEGKWASAATWLGAQDAIYGQNRWASPYFSPMERSTSDQARAACRQALGEEVFQVACEAGWAMSPEQVDTMIQDALG